MGCGTSKSGRQDLPVLKMPKNMEVVKASVTLPADSKANRDYFAKPVAKDAKGVVVDFASEFTPLPGFVVKTHRTIGSAKVFINVLKSNEIPWPKFSAKALTFPSRATFDKTNMDAVLYDHIIPPDLCVACDQDPTQTVRKEVVLVAIQQISDIYHDTLDQDYKLPLIKKGHMDDIEALRVVCFYDSRADNFDEERGAFKRDCVLSLSYWNTTQDIVFSPVVTPKSATKPTLKDDLEKKSSPKANKLATKDSKISNNSSVAKDSVLSLPKDSIASTNELARAHVEMSEVDHNDNGVSDLIEVNDRDYDGKKDADEGLTTAFFLDLYKGDCPALHRDSLLIKIDKETKSFDEWFFVLDSGYLRFYESDNKSIPFGSKIVGGLCLFGYTVLPFDVLAHEQALKQNPDKQPPVESYCFSLVPCGYTLATPTAYTPGTTVESLNGFISTPFDNTIDTKTTGKLCVFQAESLQDKMNWVHSLEGHIKYIRFQRNKPAVTRHPADTTRILTYMALQGKFAVYLSPSEVVMKVGMCKKPNPFGIEKDRLLILTSKQKLFYLDSKNFEMKGLIYLGRKFKKTLRIKCFKKTNTLKFEIENSHKNNKTVPLKIIELRLVDSLFVEQIKSGGPFINTSFKINSPNPYVHPQGLAAGDIVVADNNNDDDDEAVVDGDIVMDPQAQLQEDPQADAFKYKDPRLVVRDWQWSIDLCQRMESRDDDAENSAQVANFGDD